MSEQTILFLEVMAGFVVIIALAILGWILRRRRQRAIPNLLPIPAESGDVLAQFDGFYVSTTLDGQPLNRVAVRGLGFRSRATIAVTDLGLIIDLPGNAFFIPRADLRDVSRAQYTIDRVVESGGLVLVAWTLRDPATASDTDIDTYLRIDETQKLVDAITTLIDSPLHPTGGSLRGE